MAFDLLNFLIDGGLLGAAFSRATRSFHVDGRRNRGGRKGRGIDVGIVVCSGFDGREAGVEIELNLFDGGQNRQQEHLCLVIIDESAVGIGAIDEGFVTDKPLK